MASQMNMHGVVDLGALAAARKQEAASAVAKANAPAGVIVDVTDATFEADVLQRSATVPVILDFWATWCGPCKQLSPILEKLAAEYGGRLILAKVDADANPGLSQAFRVQSIPSVFALIAGQPVPLFQGAVPEPQVRQVFDKVLEAAAQSGVTGTVAGAAIPATAAEAGEEPEPDPRYLAIYDSVEAGQFDAAAQAAKALVDARDPEGPALAAYVAMRRRLVDVDPAVVQQTLTASPDDLAALLASCDLDFFTLGSGAIYERLVAAMRTHFAEERLAIRDRLLEYFAIEGETPATIAARKAMTAALF